VNARKIEEEDADFKRELNYSNQGHRTKTLHFRPQDPGRVQESSYEGTSSKKDEPERARTEMPTPSFHHPAIRKWKSSPEWTNHLEAQQGSGLFAT